MPFEPPSADEIARRMDRIAQVRYMRKDTMHFLGHRAWCHLRDHGLRRSRRDGPGTELTPLGLEFVSLLTPLDGLDLDPHDPYQYEAWDAIVRAAEDKLGVMLMSAPPRW